MKPYGSLSDFFGQQALRNKTSVHYSDGTGVQTHPFQELHEISLKVAHFLQMKQIKRGEPVALMMKNRPEWLAIYMGIIHAGGCALLLDIHLSDLEVDNLIRDSRARIFFTERSIFRRIHSSGIIRKVEKFVIVDAQINYLSKCIPFESIVRQAEKLDPLPCQGEDRASLIYTSGTTAKPKGVVLKHKNLLSQLVISEMLGLKEKDKVLMILPLNHAYAFSACFLTPLCQGADVYILDSLKLTELAAFIREHRLTALVLVPALLSQFYKNIMEKLQFMPNSAQALFHSLKSIDTVSRSGSHLLEMKRRLFRKVHEAFGGSIRYIISGAAGLDEEIVRTFNTLGMPVYEGYGLTETSPVVTFNFPHRSRPGSVGCPLPNVQLKVLASSDGGGGEIAVKGDPVFDGYFGT